MHKVKFVTNSLGDGDWIKVFVDGWPWTEGHSLSLFDFKELLKRLGHDVEHEEMTNFEMENYEQGQS